MRRGLLRGFFASRGVMRVVASAAVMLAATGLDAKAGQVPEIRSSASNRVPSCVTPQKLMTFLQKRNHNLDPRFKDIASYYKAHGENWNVRWDYAFYQMAVETNFLTYRRPDGKWGDVDPKQNNFAGIGTTGGGVAGDGFPDVKTGVLGQIQHLVAYSGEHMQQPVAPRTQLKQDDIILESQKLGRPVRFSDLARRWAVDPKYGGSIEWVANSYRSEFCRGGEAAEASPETLPWAKPQAASAAVPTAKPVLKRAPEAAFQPNKNAVAEAAPVSAAPAPGAVRTIWVSSPRGQPKEPAAPRSAPVAAVAPPSGLGVKPVDQTAAGENLNGKSAGEAPGSPACSVTTASYGGKKSVLIKAAVNGEQRYTVLTVLDGFEKSMTDTFIKTRAPAGEALGEFPDQGSALAQARHLCPGA